MQNEKLVKLLYMLLKNPQIKIDTNIEEMQKITNEYNNHMINKKRRKLSKKQNKISKNINDEINYEANIRTFYWIIFTLIICIFFKICV